MSDILFAEGSVRHFVCGGHRPDDRRTEWLKHHEERVWSPAITTKFHVFFSIKYLYLLNLGRDYFRNFLSVSDLLINHHSALNIPSNLLKPTGFLQICPNCIYVFCIYLRTNSDLCHLQHKLIGFDMYMSYRWRESFNTVRSPSDS